MIHKPDRSRQGQKSLLRVLSSSYRPRRTWRRRHRTKTTLRGKNLKNLIISLMMVSKRNRSQVLPKSVVPVRCCRFQDLQVLQGTSNSTRKKSQEHRTETGILHLIDKSGSSRPLPSNVWIS